ncbi:MAG: tRNA (cytidine(34)-2'-O)-methyltransferase [Phycisphaerales bacterium]|nr:tRNA (cytidine(34)-2'-O)-methyltransferase [Phycisphaerales bacterium]
MFDVVLIEPEIPANTGNIGRTCVATGCSLHLVRPLGFDTDDKACRRAGLDYWPRLALTEHDSFDDFLRARPREAGVWLLTTHATRTVFDARFRPGDALVFGKESAGLPTSLHERFPQGRLCLPMLPGERSLNLAAAVTAVVYEGLRQAVAGSALGIDPQGRLAGTPHRKNTGGE